MRRSTRSFNLFASLALIPLGAHTAFADTTEGDGRADHGHWVVGSAAAPAVVRSLIQPYDFNTLFSAGWRYRNFTAFSSIATLNTAMPSTRNWSGAALMPQSDGPSRAGVAESSLPLLVNAPQMLVEETAGVRWEPNTRTDFKLQFQHLKWGTESAGLFLQLGSSPIPGRRTVDLLGLGLNIKL